MPATHHASPFHGILRTPHDASHPMSTFNGIGSRFHGCSEIHKDGSYLSTKWFCLVVPLVPMGT